MELDALKSQWQQSDVSPANKYTMELIQQPGSGPIAKLKRSFLRQMRVIIIVPFFLFFTNINDFTVPLRSPLFWTYIALVIGVLIFSFINYRLLSKMESPTDNVKQSLQQSIKVLETRLHYKLMVLPLVLLVMVILVEITPFYQHFRMLDKWHALPAILRFGIYAAFFILQYFASRMVNRRRFGQHITRMRELLARMDEA